MFTKRQKQIFDFVKNYTKKKGFAPSQEEIKKHFRLSSVSTIHQHIEALKTKGYLEGNKNQKRAIEIVENQKMVQIPLLGTIAAGKPIEAIENKEMIEVSQKLISKGGEHYALKVSGDSMIEDGIFNNDIVIIRHQPTVENGETAVALMNGNEVTLKKIFKEKNGFRLQPANSALKPIFVKKLTIQGKVVSVIRKFDEDELTEASVEYLKNTDIKHRKSLGQYFTPKFLREALFEKLPKNIKNPKVLDPGCGTGEFLITAKKYFNNPELHGWDIDENLTGISKKNVPEGKIKKVDALLSQEYGRFDFVIGNPPYYEFTPSNVVKEKFSEIINGRLNIFSLFIYQSIKWLKDGGYLAFVVPPSMNNGAYFAKLRNFIVENSNIEYLKIIEDPKLFYGALQSTMLLILKKGKNKGDYIFKKNGILIFSENPDHLKENLKNKPTLHELNYEVKTGRLVWNQNKHLLTDNSKQGIPLIWAHNITTEGLKIPILKKEKPQYIKTNDYDIGPAIVVNRIIGSVKSAKLKAAIIPPKMKFIAENHVNVIYPPSKKAQLNLSFINNPKQINLPLENIAKQLSSKEKLEVIKNITGNTQISKTELEKLFPISFA